jgi:hypothetical protein
MNMPNRCKRASVAAAGATALLFSVAPVVAAERAAAPPAAPLAAKPQPPAVAPRKLEFDRQWKEVRAKYPLVAVRLLELHGAALAAQQELPCELEALHASESCRRQESDDCSPPPAKDPLPPCPRCRPAAEPEDIEGYLECLEERIACLT